jgi:2-polyprenyl-3-methyl-5-hydroxy-6-metoxy-1,4-benzoquinol methylase
VVQPVGGGGALSSPSSPSDALAPALAHAGSALPPAIDAEAFNRFEAAGWEERAGSYGFLSPMTRRVGGTVLALAEVAAGRQVLDVGSGPGELAASAAALGADTVGIDVAPSMVRRAALANPSIPFRVGSFEAIPAGEGTFDAVVGNFVLNHVGRPEVALAEACRVLRPGGWLALSSWDAPSRNRLLGLIVDAAAAVDAPPPGLPQGPTNFRTDEELRAMFEGAGFVDVGISHIMFEAAVSDAGTLWTGVLDSAVRIRPLVMDQPPGVQAAIREAFDRLAEVHRRPGGQLAIPVSVQVTRGRRP